jgi:hypothetical protein
MVRLVTLFNIFKQFHLYKRLDRNELNITNGGPVPQDESGEHMPFVIVDDEAFALSEHVLRPYPHRNLSTAKRIFNYRLTRARRMVECAFGILCNKCRVYHRAIDLHPDFADIVVKACCVLHNYVRARDGVRFEDTVAVYCGVCPSRQHETPLPRNITCGNPTHAAQPFILCQFN